MRREEPSRRLERALGEPLALIDAQTVSSVLSRDLGAVMDVVEDAYLLHGSGGTVNPPAQGLFFPDRPSARILSLAAHLAGTTPLSGMKWIASFPENLGRRLPRASAVIVLNDDETGRPFAFLEGSHVSAARTAASAALAARVMSGGARTADRLAVCGAGFIAKQVCRYLHADGWQVGSVAVFDCDPIRAKAFAGDVEVAHDVAASACSTLPEALAGSDLALFATTALEPHVGPGAFGPGPRAVLHLSLRDLTPDVILGAQNVTDDADHAFRGGTSLALTRSAVGNDDFLVGTLCDLLRGTKHLDPTATRIFSPFGLAVLDVALAGFVYRRAVEDGALHWIPDFFSAGPDEPASPAMTKEVHQ